MTDEETRLVRLEGPPVPDEMQQLFGWYHPHRVTGIVTTLGGIHVAFENGTTMTFVPAFTGGRVKPY